MTVARRIVETLGTRGDTLSVAESCTGGLIAAAVIAVPGASRVFTEGLVVYANEAKTARLGVPRDIIVRFGAVSHETVRALIEGLSTPARIAVSGVAGPDGGSAEKPVGTVVLGASYRGREQIVTRHFIGTRDEVRQAAADAALELLEMLLD